MKFLFLPLLALIFLSGCDERNGSGHIISEKRNTGNFSKLNASEGINVEVRRGPTCEVIVEADDNIIQLIETRVDNGTLKLGIKDGNNLNNTHVNVMITVPELTGIKASSSAEIEVKDMLSSKGIIELNASSGSKITMPLDAPEVSANASSGSKIQLSGRTRNFTGSSSSGASVTAIELLSETSKADASSGAQVSTHPSISLNGKASSGGSVTYRGAAKDIKKEESSGGSVSFDD